ncbi:DUF3943 domain-containing protein [Dysgonomonas sp. Marseille-P4361]|uniref:DUF3943 domain-containing protein n=1 Tax=Dysgonomonas sp. Marseille-P4361 TaxID=2161820 RepID=UPI000D552F62|nr:DUF3943 domain-containing protein [Dysgonomonas sp. Marseille-P4361]
MARFFILIVLLCSILSSVDAQIPIRHQVANPKPADSLDIDYYTKTKWLQAGTTAFGINMGVWAFDRYVQRGHFAYINTNTIKENFRKGFIWDNDYMSTNMFLHPYHGSLYFNAGRSNGLNYWQSSTLALAGSAMWELFMESEYPSTNDIIVTPIGGMALGEVLFRASDLIIDDRRKGWSRFGHEAATFLISPSRGLTRIINGDAWKKRSTSGKQFGIPDVSIDISMGVRALEFEDPIIDKGVGFATTISVEYGDRFEAETNKPYDYFTFKANINGQGSQPIISQLNITGRLYSTELIDNSKDFLSLGVYQHYDFYDSDTISEVSSRVPYKFSAPASFGIGLIHKSKRFKNWNFNSHFHLNTIILGASQSDHYVVKDRNYNWGSGFSWQLGASLSYKDIFSISGNYEAYKIFTWKGYDKNIDWETVDPRTLNAQGDHSQAVLHAISLRADLKLRKQWYLTAIGYNYTRDTNYRYFDNVFSTTSEGRLMLTYKF